MNLIGRYHGFFPVGQRVWLRCFLTKQTCGDLGAPGKKAFFFPMLWQAPRKRDLALTCCTNVYPFRPQGLHSRFGDNLLGIGVFVLFIGSSIVLLNT